MVIDCDPTSHEVMQDPWPYYAQLRAEAPDYEIDAAGTGRAYSEFLHGYTRMPLRVA